MRGRVGSIVRRPDRHCPCCPARTVSHGPAVTLRIRGTSPPYPIALPTAVVLAVTARRSTCRRTDLESSSHDRHCSALQLLICPHAAGERHGYRGGARGIGGLLQPRQQLPPLARTAPVRPSSEQANHSQLGAGRTSFSFHCSGAFRRFMEGRGGRDARRPWRVHSYSHTSRAPRDSDTRTTRANPAPWLSCTAAGAAALAAQLVGEPSCRHPPVGWGHADVPVPWRCARRTLRCGQRRTVEELASRAAPNPGFCDLSLYPGLLCMTPHRFRACGAAPPGAALGRLCTGEWLCAHHRCAHSAQRYRRGAWHVYL